MVVVVTLVGVAYVCCHGDRPFGDSVEGRMVEVGCVKGEVGGVRGEGDTCDVRPLVVGTSHDVWPLHH